VSAFEAPFYPPAAVPRDEKPKLVVVIDTEEEFDWDAPFSRDSRSVQNIARLPALFDQFAEFGAAPLCVLSYPVMDDLASVLALRNAERQGLCELGTHLHSWVTPPYEERLSSRNSYGCNLPASLERRKLRALTARFEQCFDRSPTMFRTGRYGVGAQTFETLVELGYRTDLSLPPHSSFAEDGGPVFYGWSNAPFWADPHHDLLSLPVTTGFSGALSRFGPSLAPLVEARTLKRMRLPGVLCRSRILERARLTPEGSEPHELKRLMQALLEQGNRVLTLSFHSSSLLPGATSYVRNEDDRRAFEAALFTSLRCFVDELGGEIARVSDVDAWIRGGAEETVCRNLRASM